MPKHTHTDSTSWVRTEVACVMCGSIRGVILAKEEPLVTELILDQPSLTKRAWGLFVEIKEMTPNPGQLTHRGQTLVQLTARIVLFNRSFI